MEVVWLEKIIKDAEILGVKVDKTMAEKLSMHIDALLTWNEKVNLTAITDKSDIVTKHVIDSLSVASLLPLGAKIIDIGSGAGFPGIPLAIARPDTSLCLFDSLAKRVNFLNAVILELKLQNACAIHGRAEAFGILPNYRDVYDVAIARAVAPLPLLLEYCLPFVKPGGLFLAMKGPGAKDELGLSDRALTVLGGIISEIRTLTLSGGEMERNIVVVKKTGRTPKGYPRKSGRISKEPL